MELSVLDVEDFGKLQSPEEQLKEILFLYGVCTCRLNLVEDFFINKLRFNAVEFEGDQIGKPLSQNEIQIKESKLQVSTLGQLIAQFNQNFDTSGYEDLFNELLRIRNLISHGYMRLNWRQMPDGRLRKVIYDDLLGVSEFLDQFEKRVAGVFFYTKKSKAFGIRWTG